jgi:hypothetical protein
MPTAMPMGISGASHFRASVRAIVNLASVALRSRPRAPRTLERIAPAGIEAGTTASEHVRRAARKLAGEPRAKQRSSASSVDRVAPRASATWNEHDFTRSSNLKECGA